MSETASFVDPVFLARFGLARFNVLGYFLHPLNPFRPKVNTGNETLSMQMIDIGTLMQQGTGVKAGPLSPEVAEEEYALALTRLNGEQCELMTPPDGDYVAAQQSPLFTIRHVLRSSITAVKVLGIYYVLEGVIYKSPSVRSLMKTNVARTIQGLSDACDALSVCARYDPSTGYTWNFDVDVDEEEEEYEILEKIKNKRKRQKKILDNSRPGERTTEEEEGIRASEAIDRILVRLSKSDIVSQKVASKATA